jgi:hypothetical protein
VLEAGNTVKADLLKRHGLRLSWASRCEDKAFQKVDEGYAPIPCPIDEVLGRERERMGELDDALRKLADAKPPKMCHMFVKFGDCKKRTCKRVHQGGVWKVDKWVKE